EYHNDPGATPSRGRPTPRRQRIRYSRHARPYRRDQMGSLVVGQSRVSGAVSAFPPAIPASSFEVSARKVSRASLSLALDVSRCEPGILLSVIGFFMGRLQERIGTVVLN